MTPDVTEQAKAIIDEVVDAAADELVAASHDIHAHPELGYEERFASARLAGLLRDLGGLAVAHPVHGIDTAFAATGGDAGPHAIVCAEYDALPDIGHGCGHNVIGTAAVGAGIALAAVHRALGAGSGRFTVLGTPAEELGGGGKKRLLASGAFEGADVAMMVHPEPGDVERVPYLASETVEVVFHGKAAHASSGPHDGINALDALVLGYQAVAALRQHIRPDHKVHGIITDGGQAENIVPVRAAGRFRVRAPRHAQLEVLKARVLACFEGAAHQTGATLEHRWLGGYRDLQANRTLAAAYRRNGERLGRRFVDPKLVPLSVAGSTDMGDVSYALPSIHPVIRICGLDVSGHSTAMAAAAVSELADRAVVDGAKALAMTVVDVWSDADLLAAVKAEFAERVAPLA